MSSVCVRMWRGNRVDLRELAYALKCGVGAELVSESWRGSDGFYAVLLTFEKFYFRNGSYASLAVMLTESAAGQTADIVGSGGGTGVFNISWGANTDFAEKAAGILRNYGFYAQQ